MDLSVGDRLGRFEILGPLGAGGMGDVYRARDPQLQREVAIKVLPEAFSRDPDRQRRFEQEARSAGSLNHPNIVAVHDVVVHDGSACIVTELLEGQTLRERMNGRALPPRKALEYAIQVASGLAAAHERGIVHRDIKPENLFVTRDGRIKILDFGLAKLIGGDSSGDMTATITIAGVQVGPVVGTAVYMSPEQARGHGTDHRSDIFSFGTVLYEMLAGFPPFRRDTTADTISAILNDEPRDLSAVAAIPPALERIVRHALEKKPEERFQSVRDLIFDLESLSATGSSAATITPRGRVLSTTRVRMALGLLAMLTAAALGYFTGKSVVPAAQSVTPYSVRRLTDFPGLEEFPAISPDRKSVAFTASVNGRRQIFVRLLAGGPPLQITKDPVDHQFPRWSPDAGSLLYFSPAQPGDIQGAIWSIPALGGSPRRVMTSIGGGDVSKDGRLACFGLVDGSIQLVASSIDGSDVHMIARSVAGYHRYPRWSPDSRWIAFQRGDNIRHDIFVVSTDGGEPRQLTNDRNMINGLAWLPDSTGIVYSSSRGSSIPYLSPLGLWEVQLDGRAPRRITPAEVSYEQPDVHDSGLMSAAVMRMRSDIWRFPFDSIAAQDLRDALPVTRQTGLVLTPTAAPNGHEIAFLSDSGGHGNLWVTSTRSGELRQITFENNPLEAVGVPAWSPDGQSIAFVSSKGNTGLDFGVWLVNPDGGNLRNLVKQGLGVAWSPDGTWLYYTETAAGALSAGFLKKIPSSGGAAVTVRSERTRNVIGLHGATMYYMVERALVDGQPEFEIRTATPEDGPSRLLARIPASRVASWQILNPALSPDGRWLAVPLTDNFTTNVWALSTETGHWRQVTDFGDRAIFIARRVSWSSEGKSILAAVGEGDTDIVLVDGLTGRP
jgi:serine/threonine protein kinase/sugar lactone lactonase YvrE